MYESITHPVGLADACRNTALSEGPRRWKRHERKSRRYSPRGEPAPAPRTMTRFVAQLLKTGQTASGVRFPIAIRLERRQAFFHPLLSIPVHIV